MGNVIQPGSHKRQTEYEYIIRLNAEVICQNLKRKPHVDIYSTWKKSYATFLYPYLTRKYIFICRNTDKRKQKWQQIHPLSTRPTIKVTIHESRQHTIYKSPSLLSE